MKNTSANPQDYLSFLLRIWKTQSDQEKWRASLEQVGSRERLNFASLQAMFEYLERVTHHPTGGEEVSRDEERE